MNCFIAIASATKPVHLVWLTLEAASCFVHVKMDARHPWCRPTSTGDWMEVGRAVKWVKAGARREWIRPVRLVASVAAAHAKS